MIEITDDIHISDKEIKEDFVHSSGPGGQNVNKVSTAVQLRFDVKNSSSIPEGVRRRLIRLSGSRMTKDGILVIKAERYRTREQNRRDAINRLAELIIAASKVHCACRLNVRQLERYVDFELRLNPGNFRFKLFTYSFSRCSP